ncbi:MAG: hypothetical protein P1U36_03375 [Legionellaceae bacterium]|nr:hypothetical protein [Legionellaceae bacterium]
MAKINARKLVESVEELMQDNKTQDAVAVIAKEMGASCSEPTDIEEIHDYVQEYVIENILSSAEYPPTYTESWIEALNELERLKESDELAPKITLSDLLKEMPQEIASGEFGQAMEGILNQISYENNAGRSLFDIRAQLVNFISEHIISDTGDERAAYLSNWLAFVSQIESSIKLNKDQFLLQLALDLPSDAMSSSEVGEWFADILQASSNRVEFIKRLSTMTEGANLLSVSLEALVKERVISPDELKEIKTFFLDTMNRLLFNLSENIATSVTPTTQPSEEERLKINRLNRCPEDLLPQLHFMMVQAKLGLARFTLDDTSLAKYILAAVRSDKSDRYEFMPTIFNVGDFNAYFEEVLKQSPPIKDSFIVMSPHWTAGQIEIKEDGSVNLFISDSLGLDKNNAYWFSSQLNSKEFLQLFQDRTVNIFYGADKRQNADEGCKVYAMDDVRHFHSMEQYMDEDNIMDYLAEHRQGEDASLAENVHLSFCQLPDTLLRTMQSKKVHGMLHDVKVNKKGETAAASIVQDFKRNPMSNRIENQRIQRKYDRMVERLDTRVEMILDSEDPHQAFADFTQKADMHTLTGFRARNTMKQQVEIQTRMKSTLDELRPTENDTGSELDESNVAKPS